MDKPSEASSLPQAPQESAAPDWNMVPFEVHCARCGHDIHGQSEPKCPSCQLEFDWADAVPLERLICLHCDYHLYGLEHNRCPECGTDFTWSEVLQAYHRRKKPHFEYRWRERPVRSLIGTWVRGLRPRKLWKSINLYDPPQVFPLVAMVLCSVVAVTVVVWLTYGLTTWLILVRSAMSNSVWGDMKRLAPVLPKILLDSFFARLSITFAYSMASWGIASFAALVILQQSMRRCKVRWDQVVRVWAYSLSALPMFGSAALGIASVAVVFTVRWLPLDGVFALIILAHVTWSLHIGYRDYLRIPHSLSVAIASQVIGVLWGGIVELAVISNWNNSLFIQILRTLHLW